MTLIGYYNTDTCVDPVYLKTNLTHWDYMYIMWLWLHALIS